MEYYGMVLIIKGYLFLCTLETLYVNKLQNKEKKSHSGLHQDFNLYKGRIYIEKSKNKNIFKLQKIWRRQYQLQQDYLNLEVRQ